MELILLRLVLSLKMKHQKTTEYILMLSRTSKQKNTSKKEALLTSTNLFLKMKSLF